jgi:hypothetical protein
VQLATAEIELAQLQTTLAANPGRADLAALVAAQSAAVAALRSARQGEVRTSAAAPAAVSPVFQPPAADPVAVCTGAVQGRIAWDYQGNTGWADENLRRLCAGAADGTQPAACFQRTMHGGISWGGGTQWAWQNAIDLCEGTNDAAATVSCFQEQLVRTQAWSEAIRVCQAR